MDAAAADTRNRPPLADAPSFIERQLPISRLSKESYKERKSVHNQTLTALGSYWKGRKPLVLVRAVVLGLLLPATDDPARDRDTFLKLMLMDDVGVRKRKTKTIPIDRALQLLPPNLHGEAAQIDRGKPRWSRALTRARRDALEMLAFEVMGLDEKLEFCARPEEMPDSALDDIWPEVNAHLGTTASSLAELVDQLGRLRFGHRPRVGDRFAGGGSIPFEAARIGCDAYASDLNPIACMLTWGAFHVVGADTATRSRIDAARAEVLAALDAEFITHGYEHDGSDGDLRLPMDAPNKWPHGWRINRGGVPTTSDDLPYVTTCPVSGWQVPMIDSRQIDEDTLTILELKPDAARRRYRLVARSNATSADWKSAKEGTVHWDGSDFYLVHSPGARQVSVRIANRAKAFLYCVEARCPKTGWLVPLLPSLEIAPKLGFFGRLRPNLQAERFEIDLIKGTSAQASEAADAGTVDEGALTYSRDNVRYTTDLNEIVGYVRLKTTYRDSTEETRDRARYQAAANRYSDMAANNLRRWSVHDIAPRPGDILGERLYCLQWVRPNGEVFYAAPTPDDLEREDSVRDTVQRQLSEWQREGLVPDLRIEPGLKTSEPIRTRGWTHWHHLFNPRQLLLLATIGRHARASAEPEAMAIELAKVVDNVARLARWKPSQGGGLGSPVGVFSNQALNTMWNYAARGVLGLESLLGGYKELAGPYKGVSSAVACADARDPAAACDAWITDPPYADAVVYHEITEFFIGWLRKMPPSQFAGWEWDSRRPLAIKGTGTGFRRGMVEAYAAMARDMPDNGIQVVMFTHQDVGVWADLAEILWAAGLQVTAGWCVVTETETALRAGNHIEGTVLLILRKRQGEETGFLNRLQRPVERAVREQLEAMIALDDRERPNFGDGDYQLAAYAAALKELTRFSTIDGQPVAAAVLRDRAPGEASSLAPLLQRAVRIASDFLVPDGLPRDIWDDRMADERFYLKALELEHKGENRYGVYQEMGRGFQVDGFADLLASGAANHVRLKTARELAARNLMRSGSADSAEDSELANFAASIVRHALYGIYVVLETADLRQALSWFAKETPEYWHRQREMIAILDYIATIRTSVRTTEAEAASALSGAVHNHRL